MHRTAPMTKNYVALNVNSANVEKLWPKGKAQAWFLTLKCQIALKGLSLFQYWKNSKYYEVASGTTSLILARILFY